MAIILTPEDAKAAAKEVLQRQQEVTEQKKFEFKRFMDELQKVSPSADAVGFNELASLLSLPEEAFAVIAPAFLSELERGLKNVNDEMTLV